MKPFVSGCCQGETCHMCGTRPAEHKVAEVIQYDDPNPNRHELTAYVCHHCFCRIMGPFARNRAMVPDDYDFDRLHPKG